MKRRLVLAAVAGSLMIVSAAAVLLFRAKSLPTVGAHPLTQSSNSQSSSAGTPHAVAVIVADKSSNANAPASPATNPPGSAGIAGRKEEPLDPRLSSPAEDRVRQRIIEALRGTLPGAAPFLAQEGSRPATQDEIFAVLLHTLEAAQSASPAEQPPLLLAADFLASNLDLGMKSPPEPETQRKLDDLARYGLIFRWGELGATWVYSHDLLWRVRRDFPDSPWAEDAFILLLGRDWDSTFDCKGGSDVFHAVIREGENFLATRLQSRYRLETSYLVAQAYETWWSLSRAKACGSADGSGCEDDIDPGFYIEGAEAARQKTITYYEQVLQLEATGAVAADARRHLDDIKQNLDTGQRRFYCIYD